MVTEVEIGQVVADVRGQVDNEYIAREGVYSKRGGDSVSSCAVEGYGGR